MYSIHFWQLVFTSAALNLKAESANSILTYAWWFLEPLLFVLVFYIVFGIFMAQDRPGFVIFLLCGQVPFLWFSRSVMNSCSSIEHGVGLMQQIKLPKLYFPLVTFIQDSAKSLVVFILMLLFFVGYGQSIHVGWLTLPIVIMVQALLVFSLSLMVAMIVPFIPDIKYLVATGIQLVMFGSGIFYNYQTVIKPEHRDLFLLNPFANIIEQYRTIIIQHQLPDWGALAVIASLSVLLIVILVVTMKRLDSVYPRVLVE